MVLLLLPKSSTRPNRVPCNGIQYYGLVTRCLLGFNIWNELAFFVTYAAMLVDGNMITNLLSIGGKSSKTCPDPLLPVDWTHMPFLKVRSLGLCTITPIYW